jgi:hypothetical protein
MEAMIRHIIMWQLHDSAQGCSREENIRRIEAALQTMQRDIPQMLNMQVGRNITTAAHACDVVLVADFQDDAALHSYQSHPAHQAFIRFIAPLRAAKHMVDFRL